VFNGKFLLFNTGDFPYFHHSRREISRIVIFSLTLRFWNFTEPDIADKLIGSAKVVSNLAPVPWIGAALKILDIGLTQI